MNGACRRPSLALSDVESSCHDFQQPDKVRSDYSSSLCGASSFSSVPSIMLCEVSGFNGIADNRTTKRGSGQLKVCLSDNEASLSCGALKANAPRARTLSRVAVVPATIEIAPGQFASLHGSTETQHANHRDFIRPCICLCCRVELHCIHDAAISSCVPIASWSIPWKDHCRSVDTVESDCGSRPRSGEPAA
jgi:hypothetical protein